MKEVKILTKFFPVICLFCIITSCFTINKRMTSSEYFDYLRKDTVICELKTFNIENPLESVLDTIIKSWENCEICKMDPHPFIFEVNEITFGDTLIYTIRTNTSPKLAKHSYLGAFTYKENIFVVLKKSSANSSFIYNETNDPTKIYFCDRIHSSECGIIIEYKWFSNNSTEMKVECLKEPIIKIK